MQRVGERPKENKSWPFGPQFGLKKEGGGGGGVCPSPGSATANLYITKSSVNEIY